MLVKTSSIDHADWNYDGVLGFVSRRRFALALELLPPGRHDILEIGYGSGVFLPTLASRATSLQGVDVHTCVDKVMTMLETFSLRANLYCAPAEALPFADASLDVVVAVSALEFVNDLTAAVREIARVLRPEGRAIVVTPGTNAVLDLALKLATGQSARDDFGDRRACVVPTLCRELDHERSGWWPLSWPIPVYRALRLRKRV